MTASDRLPVFFRDRRVGELCVDHGGRFRFAYDASWRNAPDAFGISASLPLTDAEPPADAAHFFFANLLPEGEVRRLVARRLGISEDNDFELLRAIGGECAGALVVGDEPASPGLRELSAASLAALAREGGALSHAVDADGTRLSLAGAQDKLPVRVDGDRILLPRGASASTHVLKFPNPRFAHMPTNEAFTMVLAGRVGLPVCETRLLTAASERLLLIRRYDRVVRDDDIVRLHQEDMCQALGVPSHRKYEKEGGPGFAKCIDLITRVSAEPIPDTLALIRWLAFCAVVSNADGHGKNLSLLRSEDGRWRLAPFYDLLCTGIYERVDRNLAMRVGDNTMPGQIRHRDWQALARQASLGARLVLDNVRELAGSIEAVARASAAELRDTHGDSPALERILRAIRKQARRTRELLDE